MASMERLTKRVKKMEEWIEENEDLGGPQGTLDTFNFLISEIRKAGSEAQNNQMSYQRMRQLMFSFLEGKKLESEWDEFVKEQDNAVQEQQAEEVPAQEEAESGEEAVEAPEEKNK